MVQHRAGPRHDIDRRQTQAPDRGFAPRKHSFQAHRRPRRRCRNVM